MHSPAVDIDKGNSEDDEERRKRKRQSTSKWRDKKKRFNRDGKLEWSVYKIGSPISNSTGELELFDFIQRLENISTLATTKQDRIARLLEHTATKLDLLDKLRCELIGCPPDDIILVSDTESFEAALAKSFQVPILYRPATSSEQFGIRQLLRHLAENEHASVEVYDYSIEDSSKRTRKSSVHELLSCFQPENSHQPALNFLDIENRTKIPFCPPSITLQDVRTKIETQTQDSIGKIGSEWTGEQLKESFLLSKKGAISPIHVDTFASITWIRLLDGQKIWYYPPKVTPQTLRWLARSGSQVPEHYEGGWVKVVLRPADILYVMRILLVTLFLTKLVYCRRASHMLCFRRKTVLQSVAISTRLGL